MTAVQPTEAEQALSAALLRELAPEHVDHYRGLLTVTVEADHRGDGCCTGACETGIGLEVDASLAWCSCGDYMPGVIVSAAPGRVRTGQELAEIVSRLTGISLGRTSE